MSFSLRGARAGGELHLRRAPLLRDGPGVAFGEAMAWARRGGPLRAPFPFDEVHLHVHDAERMTRPLLASLLARAAGRRAWIEDEQGARRAVGAGEIGRRAAGFARDLARTPALRLRIARRLAALERETPVVARRGEGAPLYLRTDLWFGVRTGGAAAHVAGVVNHLGDFFAPPVVLATDELPLIRPGVEVHRVRPPAEFWDFRELPNLRFNEFFPAAARRIVGARAPGFVYQRYCEYDFTGVELARGWGVPLVVEFNAPALWVARHWGSGLRFERLAERVERLVLRSAALVVVVSEPLAALVRAQGVPDERILVNPNGVEPDRFAPSVDGSRVRARWGLQGRRVIGFIGTLGPWHGAEVLAEAFGRLLRRDAELRLLLVGDGARAGEVRAALARNGAGDAAILPGLIPIEEAPEYLAACDVLVAPHVPNPDGSPFFGSPTKLFEYMAMGRPIVASALDQIAEVIRHDGNGWLVAPGDAESLADGIARLLADPERAARLGAAARRDAVERWSWHAHTGRIAAALEQRVSHRDTEEQRGARMAGRHEAP